MEINNIIIENRMKTNISGVTDVVSFSEAEVILDTQQGGLVLHGENFRINKLSVEIGEVIIEGKLNSFIYETPKREKESVWAKMFK
ncbi:MAG: sporulation protein YabP [Oscillospiraceae bacterium]|nr:sporulation protein YabP [Oscillospiraceae bacterium]